MPAQAGLTARPIANSATGMGTQAGIAHSRRAPDTVNPAPTIVLGVLMGVTVPRDPGPHRGVGDLLQPRPRTAAGDVFEVAQLAAGFQQRKQLSHNLIGFLD